MQNCFIQGCSSPAIIHCNCFQPAYSCQLHLCLHQKSLSSCSHDPKYIASRISAINKKILLQGLLNAEKIVENYRAFILNEFHNIKSTLEKKFKCIDDILTRLKDNIRESSKYFSTYTEKNSTAHYLINLLLSEPEKIKEDQKTWRITKLFDIFQQDPQINMQNYLDIRSFVFEVKKFLQLGFIMKETRIYTEQYESFNFLDYVDSESRCISSVNLETCEITKQEINFGHNLAYPLVKNIPGGFMIVVGGRVSNCSYSNKYYLIDCKTTSVVLEGRFMELDDFSGSVIALNSLYVFGGKVNKSCLNIAARYCIKSNMWMELAPLPFYKATNNPVYCDGLIYIVGYDVDYLFVYSLENDCYRSCDMRLERCVTKTLLKNKKQIYLIYNDLIYKKSSEDLNNWGRVGSFIIPDSKCVRESIEYKDFIYFRDNNNLFRMDTQQNSIECLIDIDYTREKIRRLRNPR